MTDRELLEVGLRELKFPENPQAVEKMLRFSALLQEKNKVMNLTAIEEPTEIVTRHFLDCAALSPLLPNGADVLDVGTGAGFPGMPLAILREDVTFTLLDAQQKRIDFLSDCIETLSLHNATAKHVRAEEFAAQNRASFDVVVSRAVAALPMLCELSLPAVRVGGLFCAMKALDCGDEVAQAAHAIETLGGRLLQVKAYTVPCSDVQRAVVLIEKVADTPTQYPRRFKKIETKPL